MWWSTLNKQGDRKRSIVNNCHDLGALTTLGFTNFSTPFFASTNEASIKVSVRSIFPRFLRSSTRVRIILSKIPSSTHLRKCLYQVEPDGYPLGVGRSPHLAPTLITHKTPCNISLVEWGGLPPLSDFCCAGKSGSSTFHCSLVSFIPVTMPQWGKYWNLLRVHAGFEMGSSPNLIQQLKKNHSCTTCSIF